MTGHPTRTALLLAAAGGLLAGCAMWSGTTSPSPHTPPDTSAAGDCPPVKADSGHAAVDFVDFVKAHDTTYLVAMNRHDTVHPGDVGAVQFRVRCSLATLNDLTHAAPPEARNHDAAFLHPGTSVHAVKGWSPLCRLTARHDGAWYVYLALRTDASTATPKDCALRRTAPTAGQR